MPSTLPIPTYTVEDYLHWKGDWELWDGHPISTSTSPSRWHQQIASELHFLLRGQIDQSECEDCTVFFELDWHVSSDTVLRPDLIIVCEEDDADEDFKFIRKTPSLTVEIISPSRPHNDRVVKRSIYEREGVPYYLILDPEDPSQNQLLVLDQEGTYQDCDDRTIEQHPGCRLTIPKDLSP